MECMRSKLFLPATRLDLAGKALASGADAVCIDLEDAVTEAGKDDARRAASLYLQSVRRSVSPPLIVRINAVGGDHWRQDLEAAALPSVVQINLPKVEQPDVILMAAAALDVLERQRGILSPIGLLINIETPAALARAAQLASAHPRVAGLQVGFGDLFLACGIDRNNAAARDHVRMTVSIAAAQAGIPCYDGAFADVHDTAGLAREARKARAFGFTGKSCIHPRQVATVNAAFTPGGDEMAWAHKIVEAAGHVAAPGQGAFLVDGQMVDEPLLRLAQRLLARARV